jgi:transposase
MLSCVKNGQQYKVFILRIAEHLKQCKIDTVAMESTGVYWIPLFLILQDSGFDVYLVNAQHVKNVTGRKDDEEDTAWIQRLHSCGLLNRSFQPDNDTRKLRTFVRHRKNLIESQSQHVNRMIKALELMNIKLHTVISDILGKSEQAILHAILKEGVRDASYFIDIVVFSSIFRASCFYFILSNYCFRLLLPFPLEV